MKHLIPYLQDDRKAADYLRQLRWPAGVTCPRCGGDAVEPRERCDNGLVALQLCTALCAWASCLPCSQTGPGRSSESVEPP